MSDAGAALARGVTGHHLAAARRHGKCLGLTLVFACQRRLCRARLSVSFEEFLHEKGLGPDALDESLDRDWFLERLARKRGTVKNALMDQSLLAGIGNEYVDEILFQLGLHPGVALDEGLRVFAGIEVDILESGVIHCLDHPVCRQIGRCDVLNTGRMEQMLRHRREVS